MNFIFIKKNYKYYITIIGSLTNILFCIYSLMPPYLLKKPNFYIYQISNNNSSILLFNKSIEYDSKYCNSSKYIMKKDPNSLNNLAYEYDIYCSNKKEIFDIFLVISLFTGATLGNIIFETFPDKYGREKIYKYLSLFGLFLQINLILDFGMIHLIIIFFFIGINLYIFPLSLVVVKEFIIDDLGIIFGIVNGIYPFGGILIAFWFMTINNLKLLFIIYCIFLIIFNIYLFKYFYESPRWLHSQNRRIECLEVLDKVSKFNNIENDWLIYQKDNPKIIELIGTKSNKHSEQTNTNVYGFLKILKIDSQRNKFINSLLTTILTGNCFYGIILYLDKMKGNFFFNAIFTFLGELIAELAGGYLTDKFGRKKVSIYLMLFGTIFFILYDILPEQFSWITLFFSMMGFAGNFTCLSILINETFVTEIRGTIMSDCFIMDRLVPIFIKILGIFLNNKILDIIFILSAIGSAYITYKGFNETLGLSPKNTILEEEEDNLKASFLNSN